MEEDDDKQPLMNEGLADAKSIKSLESFLTDDEKY
jgi:hypothetical protein